MIRRCDGEASFCESLCLFSNYSVTETLRLWIQNIRLLPLHNCKWADQILDRHLIVQNIIHFGHLLYHRNFSLQTRVALKRNRQSVLKNVSLRDNQAKIVINFFIAVLTMLREFQYIKPTETFEISILFGTYRIFKQRRLSRVYVNAQPRLSFRCLQ